MKIHVKERGTAIITNPQKGIFHRILRKSNGHNNNSVQYLNMLKIAHTAIYICLLLILNMVLLVQIYKCYDRYTQGPTYIETKIVKDNCPTGRSDFELDGEQANINYYLLIIND